MTPISSTGPHTYRSLLPFNSLDRTSLQLVAQDASEAKKGRARVCCHQDLEDSPQEMLICLVQNTYIRPHKHFDRAESGLAISGMADAVFFDGNGNVIEAWPMGTLESGLRFFYRIQTAIFHCLLVRSEMFIFHEVSTGPFTQESTEFAPWAPPQDDLQSVSHYLVDLGRRVDEFYQAKTNE